jgi:hypothetical protein
MSEPLGMQLHQSVHLPDRFVYRHLRGFRRSAESAGLFGGTRHWHAFGSICDGQRCGGWRNRVDVGARGVVTRARPRHLCDETAGSKLAVSPLGILGISQAGRLGG